MTWLQSILLGAVQGATEFLPISSSGHLILTRTILGIQQAPLPAFIFDVLVQLGTWVAVLIYYWADLVEIITDMLQRLRGKPGPQAKLGWLLIIASIPAVFIGWFAKDTMTGDVAGLPLTGVFLLVNAGLLFLAELGSRRTRKLDDANPGDALWVGLFQALALLPAVSRSASTLAGGMTRNFGRRSAARFAFLMALPIMPAAAVVAFFDLGRLPDAYGLALPLFFGFLSAAISGYFSIRWLLKYLAERSLFPFAAYCLIVGSLVIGISML